MWAWFYLTCCRLSAVGWGRVNSTKLVQKTSSVFVERLFEKHLDCIFNISIYFKWKCKGMVFFEMFVCVHLASARKRIFSSGGKSSLHVLTATDILSRCSVPLNTSPKLPWQQADRGAWWNIEADSEKQTEVRWLVTESKRKCGHLSQQLAQYYILMVQDPLLVLHREPGSGFSSTKIVRTVWIRIPPVKQPEVLS